MKTRIRLSLIGWLALTACDATPDARLQEPVERATPFFLPLFSDNAKDALARAGIEREAVDVEYLPMSIDRLVVKVASLDPAVPDLGIVFWNLGQGWVIERPPRDEVDAWLERSGPR